MGSARAAEVAGIRLGAWPGTTEFGLAGPSVAGLKRVHSALHGPERAYRGRVWSFVKRGRRGPKAAPGVWL